MTSQFSLDLSLPQVELSSIKDLVWLHITENTTQ